MSEDVKNLTDRLPPEGLDDDDAFGAFDIFVDWVADLGLELYPHQEEAILEIMGGAHVILNTPTGSGKSLVATAMHFRSFALGRRSFYTSPIKALVSEKFFALCDTFGADSVGMMTGDSSINKGAPIVCCTAEILANIALREGEYAVVDDVIMDEFHYYSDRDRGMAWQIPLLTLPQATFLLMSATLGDTREIQASIQERTGRGVTLVSSNERPVPLEFKYSETPLHETVAELVRRGRAPVYLVNFTQRASAEEAQSLMSTNFSDKEEKRAIIEETREFRFDTPYGPRIRRFIHHGVGLHHGGLLPKYRLLVERLSRKGLLKIISGTDTLGVGVNVPIRTVLFTKLCKFDGEKVGILSVRDFKQIAGRAGRKGFDDIGYVVAQAPAHVIENIRAAKKAASAGKKKKFVKSKPPTRGYAHWDEGTFERLINDPPETLTSTFKIDHGVLLNMMQREGADWKKGGGYKMVLELIARSHEHAGAKTHHKRRLRQLFQSLLGAGIIELVERPSGMGRGKNAVVSEHLQQDFSLFQTLSLFLVHLVDQLDPEHEDYGVDVLTCVESILENPRAILFKQVDQLKTDLIRELKERGVEYEERMEKLEQVTYEKPRAEMIYRVFNAFSAEHPWVGEELIRPKSVARDMYERYMSFADYVRDLGLQAIEGVLYRYLGQVFKTLVQTVPEDKHTDEVVDIIAYLRNTLAVVDQSLVLEWERMLTGASSAEDPDQAPPPVDISQDPRRFHARIRTELHHIVRCLSQQDWAAAVGAVRQLPEDPWDATRFERELAGFFDTYETLVFDHRARLSDKTTIQKTGPHQWHVAQVLCDPEGDDLWGLEGLVDLREDTAPEGPLIALTRISD